MKKFLSFKHKKPDSESRLYVQYMGSDSKVRVGVTKDDILLYTDLTLSDVHKLYFELGEYIDRLERREKK